MVPSTTFYDYTEYTPKAVNDKIVQNDDTTVTITNTYATVTKNLIAVSIY